MVWVDAVWFSSVATGAGDRAEIKAPDGAGVQWDRIWVYGANIQCPPKLCAVGPGDGLVGLMLRMMIGVGGSVGERGVGRKVTASGRGLKGVQMMKLCFEHF